ncbi:MAG TPA: HemK/PrmC family methyltransferase, partial [Longimicrobiales bacterium]|nr:HemK/PrmC family methyltransferase [Longimicrobiales bacterium]
MRRPGTDGSANPVRERGGEPWTVLRMIRWSAAWLEGKGVERGRLDGEHLLAHVLDLSRLQLYLQYERPLTADELAAYKPLLLRRARREPLQYILGRTSFRELELRTDHRALVPRPETERLVQEVLDWAASRDPSGAGSGGLTALDVGTGTGCIALSLAREGPFARVVATDTSGEALELARENAREAGLDQVVELVAGPLFQPVGEERFDVVVSNPPYVA